MMCAAALGRTSFRVAADEDGPLDLAHEDGGAHSQGRRAAQAHGLLEDKAKGSGHRLEDAPVPEQGGQGADHQDDRQDAEGEDKEGAGVGDIVGLALPACKEAEDEGHAGLGGGGEGLDPLAEGGHHGAQGWQPEEAKNQEELDQEGASRQPPGKDAPVLGERPAQGDDDDQPKEALGVLDAEHELVSPVRSAVERRKGRGATSQLRLR